MSPRVEVRFQRGGDVGVALADLRGDEGVGRIFPRPLRELLHFGDPERQRFVASGDRLEAQILVVGELLLERVFTILECVGHDGLRHFLRRQTLAKSRGGDSTLPGPLSAG